MTGWGRVSAILLAGGTGTRMGGDTPKQYLPLDGKPVAHYSFDLFVNSPAISELIVVCHPDYRHYFSSAFSRIPLVFAEPGPRRQDSVYNGLQAASQDADYICIHDAARPMITHQMLVSALEGAAEHGAATVGVPLKATVKQSYGDNLVHSTLERSCLWEIQTPQVIRATLLRDAFQHALAHNIAVTDDVSLVEALGKPVKLVQGDYSNLKITTPDDLVLAECLLDKHAALFAHTLPTVNDNYGH